MKKLLSLIVLCTASLTANAQLMYGNTFPFWNVNGPLTVVGATSLTGATTQVGALGITGVTTVSGAIIGDTTQALMNTVSTTLNIGGAATAVTLGAATGTVTVGPAIVGSIATDSTSPTTGAIKTAGGVGVAKALFVGTTTTTAALVIGTTASPASGAACTAGTIVWDTSYIYVCTATGAWKRAALTGAY